MTYYFFDEYGECFVERWFALEEEAEEYAYSVDAEYFCRD